MTCLTDKEGLPFGDIFSGIDPKGNIALFQDDTYESRLQCIDCSLREKCIGGCAAVNFETTGSLITPAPDECRFAKAFEKAFVLREACNNHKLWEDGYEKGRSGCNFR